MFLDLPLIFYIMKAKPNFSKMSDEELISMAIDEVIKTVKAVKDGQTVPKPRFKDELERRGIKLQITTGFIRRILSGEFG